MIILAGVDEAGLGPTLGPLVTASAALAVPDDWLPDTPWRLLADAVADGWKKGEARPAVADSKELYRRGGMEALELTVGVFSLLAGSGPSLPLAFPDDHGAAATHPAYSRALCPFPSFTGIDAMAAAAKRVEAALAGAGAAAMHLEAAALYEPVLNRRYTSGMNKNQALLVETGRHLARLEARFPESPVIAVVDKQGGRNQYLPFLTALFPGAWIDVLTEGGQASVYRLRRKGGDVEFRFLPKADRTSFPTALASLAAKYTRERAVAEMNAWFSARLPGLKPTAGYPEDARRWLAEIRSTPEAGELGLDLVIRKK